MSWECAIGAFVCGFVISTAYMIGRRHGKRYGLDLGARCLGDAEKTEDKKHYFPYEYVTDSVGHKKVPCCDELDKREKDRKEKAAIEEKKRIVEEQAKEEKLWSDLPICSAEPKCSRCGSVAVTTSSTYTSAAGYYSWPLMIAGHPILRRACCVCAFKWDEKPLDAVKEEVGG